MSLHDLAVYLGNLIAAGACHLAAWEIGRRIYPAIAGGSGKSERAFFSAVLGFVVLGNVAFVLGALHLFYRPVLGLVVAVPALSGAVHLARTKPWRAISLDADDTWLLLAAAFLVAAIPLALAPVLEHDDNVYHLALPKAYLALHRLAYQPILYANMPHLVELIYTYPMALGDFTAAKTLNLMFNFWCLLGLRSAAGGGFGRTLGGLAALVYLSNPVLQWHLGLGYVEPVLAVFLFSAVIALLRFMREGEPRLLFIVGIGCGAAAATKYQGWVYSAAIFLVAAVSIGFRPISWRSRLEMAARVLLPFGLLVAPWLVKNLVLTGDPLFPMAYHVFGGRGLSDIQVLHLSRSAGFFSVFHMSLGKTIALPFEMVAGREVWFSPGFSATMMILASAAFFVPASYRRHARPILGLALGGYAGWVVINAVGRFFVAWLPVVTLAAMLPLAPLAARRGARAAVAVLVIVVAAVQNILVPIAPTLDVSRRAFLATPRADLLARNFNFDLCAILNSAVPPHGKVLGMWENRFFFLDREAIADSNYEAPAALARLREAGDPKRFADELRAEGVTHVVVRKNASLQYFDQAMLFSLLDDRLYPQSALDRDRALYLDFLKTQLVLLIENDATMVFRLPQDRPEVN